jgi:hypothetical protein
MALVGPPNPGVQANTLAVVRRLSWSPVEDDVGELVGGWLVLAACSEGRALWCAGEGHAPVGLAPRLIAKDAFVAMRDGRWLQDGSLAWQNQRWTLADVAEGGQLVARLAIEVPAT